MLAPYLSMGHQVGWPHPPTVLLVGLNQQVWAQTRVNIGIYMHLSLDVSLHTF